jgi:hypothetical protein
LRHVLPALLLVALGAPGTAGAHLSTSRSAVDFRASVSHQPREAVDVRIYRSDLALALTARPGHSVVVLGYLGEPFLRVGRRGVFVNGASPTAAGTGLASERGQGWRLLSHRQTVIWHDARLRGLPSGHKRGSWRVPLVVDGRRMHLSGEIVRVPRPSVVPWIALGLLFAGIGAVLLAVRRMQLLRLGTASLGALAAAATLATAIGFAAASTASTGTWIESANEIAFLVVVGAFLVRGTRDTKALAGGTLGLIALAVALTKLPVLLHGIVLSALPAQAARLAEVVALAAGSVAAILGVVVFFDVLEHYEEPELARLARWRHDS